MCIHCTRITIQNCIPCIIIRTVKPTWTFIRWDFRQSRYTLRTNKTIKRQTLFICSKCPTSCILIIITSNFAHLYTILRKYLIWRTRQPTQNLCIIGISCIQINISKSRQHFLIHPPPFCWNNCCLQSQSVIVRSITSISTDSTSQLIPHLCSSKSTILISVVLKLLRLFRRHRPSPCHSRCKLRSSCNRHLLIHLHLV